MHSGEYSLDFSLDTAHLDQHLLTSPDVLRTLVNSARPTSQDVIADLGAGTGVITKELAERGVARVRAVEIDQRFGPRLEQLSRHYRNVDVIAGDFMTTPLPDVTKVVANPPFGLTEPLVSWLHRLPAVTSISVVMGRSFGASATAAPGSREYNRISLGVQSRFAVRMVAAVPSDSFYPVGRTPACIVQMVPKRGLASIDAYVDAAFANRGGMKLKDLLWHLRVHGPPLESPATRQQLAVALRRSAVVREIYQLRLQQIRSADLSRLMAELHRLAGHG